MKKINKIVFSLISASGLSLLVGCTDNFKELNTDPSLLNADIVNVDYMLTYVEKTAFRDLSSDGSGTYGSYCGMCRRDDDAPFADQEDEWVWNAGYKILINNSTNIIRLLDSKENKADLVNKTAIARIVRAWSVARVSDTYGDIPYSEACLPANQVILRPKYDSQKDIYSDLFKELKEAATQLDASKASYGNADIVYKGDVTKWKKLANSLRLRMALRVSYADQTLATAQLSDLTESDLITTLADEASFPYEDDKPAFKNPRFVYVTVYGSKTNDQVFAHKVMIDIMLNDGVNLDPRIQLYADTVTAPFKGGISPNGYVVPNWLYRGCPTLGSVEDQYRNPWGSSTVSRLADFWRVGMTKPAIMKSSEVYFNLAEAKLRGLLPASFSGTADSYYKKGIDRSIEWYKSFYDLTSPQIDNLMRGYLKPNWTAADVTKYLAHKKMDDLKVTRFKATPIYTLSGTTEKQLEMVINQKIVALYPDEFQGWCEYRRTGYPKIPIGPDNSKLQGKIPRRESWPTVEETINTDNYQEALARYNGSDSRAVKFWWDANSASPHVYEWVAPSMPNAY